MRVEDVTDLATRFARSFITIFGVSFIAVDKSRKALRSLEQLADTSNIACSASSDFDIISIGADDLASLLEGLIHWNFHCWDCPRAPSSRDLARQAELLTSVFRKHMDTPVLNLLSGARFFLDSHDDDMLTVETRDHDFVRALLSRALELLMADMIVGATGLSRHRIDVPPAPTAVLDFILARCPSFGVCPVGTKKTSRLRLAFGVADWSFPWGACQAVGHVDYDLHTDRWIHLYH
jgi:hypothetical protein